MEIATDYAPTYAAKPKSRWFRRLVYLSMTIGLIASNVASVLSTSFHDMLYKAVAAELVAMTPTKASRLLARTPTARLATASAKLNAAKVSVKGFNRPLKKSSLTSASAGTI